LAVACMHNFIEAFKSGYIFGDFRGGLLPQHI
jgi:hypothetical protein